MTKKNITLASMLLVLSIILLAACGKTTGGAASDKVLTIGTEATFAPFEYMDKGKMVGFDVDLINAVAKEAGYKVNMKNDSFASMLTSVQNKQDDAGIAGITITDKRKQAMDFSNPYFKSQQLIVLKDGSTVTNAKDLKGKKIGVQADTTGQIAVEKLFGKNNSNIKKYETTALAFMALQSGDVDAVVSDGTVVNEYVKNNPKKKLKVVSDDKNFTPEFYGIALPKDSDLKAKFDKALTTIMDNGTYNKIYKKWFKVDPDTKDLK